ncbi:class I SAM-dependent methyltransferase [Actinomycetospora aeridis]|uniref:Class I SAM-dependent methyltransferase n=1 Tax=Actinomycetospora aeridis TaxID=3129231 RepID=A0ABU8N2Z3_9PSEU
MGLGAAVRRRLGPLESPAAEAYRSIFIDLRRFADRLAARRSAERILEIGCGDGSTADQLCRAFPNAEYVGIDVAPDPGRRCGVSPERTSFSAITSSDLRRTGPQPFSLVVLVDVLHHIPDDADRRTVLADAVAMTEPGGTLVIKEWSGHRSLGYGLAYAADRYVSGDRDVRFTTEAELMALFEDALPGWTVAWRDVVRPWANNIVLALERR